MWLPRSFVVFFLAVAARSALVNTTIDDSNSNFTFTGSWVTITPSDPCSGCETKPDTSQIHDGTWHDGSIHSSGGLPATGSFTFQGSAVYIFGIDQNSIEADIVFTLGDIKQTHHYTGLGTITNTGIDQFVYNALFFSATGLPSDQTQTVSWVLNLADTGSGLQIGLFDYAIVTTGEDDLPDAPPATSVQPNQATTQGSFSNNNNSPNTSIGSPRPITTLAPSSSRSGANQSSTTTSSETSYSSRASQTNNPTTSNEDQVSSPTVTIVSSISGPTSAIPGGGIARSRSKFNVGAIAGGISGALVVITLVVLLVWYRLRRARGIKPDITVRSQFLGVADYPIFIRPAEKMPQVSTSPSKSAMMMGSSTISLLRPQNEHTASAPTAPRSNTSTVHNSSSPIVTATTTSREMRWVEERLAALESQMAGQPPPYLHEDDH